MVTPDYDMIAQFNVGIQVTQTQQGEAGPGETLIPTSQVLPTLVQMESVMKQANAMCDLVTIDGQEAEGRPRLATDQWPQVGEVIGQAVATLFSHLTDVAFLTNEVETLQPVDLAADQPGLDRYVYTEDTGGIETQVQLAYEPEIFADELIYPARVGAIINRFVVTGR